MATDVFGQFYKKNNFRYPLYAEKSARRNSYFLWPANKEQTPDVLSEAGFFHTGKEDCLRCFCCGGGLKNWLPGDIPFVEHARWFPGCSYLLEKKGSSFVERVHIDYPREYEIDTADGPSNTGTERHTDVEDIVNSVMERPCGKALLFLDYPRTVIRDAIISLLSKSDWDETRITSENLTDTVIDLDDKADEDKKLRSSENAQDELLNGATGGAEGGATEGTHSGAIAGATGGSTDIEDTKEFGLQFNHVISAELTSSQAEDLRNLMTENQKLKDQIKCKVCLEKDVTTIFLPCCHLVTCSDCSEKLKRCPLCRKKIITRTKAYL